MTIPILPVLLHIIAFLTVAYLFFRIYKLMNPYYKPGKNGTNADDRAASFVGWWSVAVYCLGLLIYYGQLKFTWL